MPKPPPKFEMPPVSTILMTEFVLIILVFLLLPLPEFCLDFFVVINFTFALTVVFIALHTQRLANVASLSPLLIFSALLRLGLSVALYRRYFAYGLWVDEVQKSAETLLSHYGTAMVEGFANLTGGGNLIWGSIILTVLPIVVAILLFLLFLVSGFFKPNSELRIALEDKKLESGLATPEEAANERLAILADTHVYNALRGSALILVMELLLGLLITVALSCFSSTFTHDSVSFTLLSFPLQSGTLILDSKALPFFLLISTEALVRGLPLLLIALGLGILLTRRDDKRQGLGEQVVENMMQHPYSLLWSAMTLFLFVMFFLVIGRPQDAPWWLFIPLGLILCSMALSAFLAVDVQAQLQFMKEAISKRQELLGISPPDQVPSILLEVDASLSEQYQLYHVFSTNLEEIFKPPARPVLVIRSFKFIKQRLQFMKQVTQRLASEEGTGSNLLYQLQRLQEGLLKNYGYTIESIQVRINSSLERGQYRIVLQEKVMVTGFLPLVAEEELEASSICEFVNQFKNVLLDQAELILTHHKVSAYIEQSKKLDEALILQLMPAVVSVWDVQQILVALLQARISIKNSTYIFERVARLSRQSPNTEALILALKSEFSAQ